MERLVVGTPRVQPNNTPPYSGEWVDYDWQGLAACRDSGEDMITPEDPPRVINTWCRQCPVRVECGREALRLDAIRGATAVGVWGGVFISLHAKQKKNAIRTLRVLCYPEKGDAA